MTTFVIALNAETTGWIAGWEKLHRDLLPAAEPARQALHAPPRAIIPHRDSTMPTIHNCGLEIHYEIHGTGYPVRLLHGGTVRYKYNHADSGWIDKLRHQPVVDVRH